MSKVRITIAGTKALGDSVWLEDRRKEPRIPGSTDQRGHKMKQPTPPRNSGP